MRVWCRVVEQEGSGFEGTADASCRRADSAASREAAKATRAAMRLSCMRLAGCQIELSARNRGYKSQSCWHVPAQ